MAQITPSASALGELLASTATAKRLAAELYVESLAEAPDAETRRRQRALADAAQAVARQLAATTEFKVDLKLDPGARPATEGWSSALLLAFAVDQAATATLAGLARSPDPRLATLAGRLVEQGRAHQPFVLDALAGVSNDQPGLGRRLALEMLAARDWIKAFYPRHTPLSELAAAGLLADDAARVHDTFLASLGDRIQEALGVLGEL